MLGVIGGSLVFLMALTACGAGDTSGSPASHNQISYCATPTSTVHEANDDIAELARLASMAMEVAGEYMADPVLRQVDVGGSSGIQSFRFTNASATNAMTINFPDRTIGDPMPEVVNEEFSPLLGHSSQGISVKASKDRTRRGRCRGLGPVDSLQGTASIPHRGGGESDVVGLLRNRSGPLVGQSGC